MNNSSVRVRFAPSPTGYLHVGGLRTALYNYLFAKHHKGTYILRIEDTDRSRYVEGAVQNLIESLRWAGLEYDEGPGKEGAVGPYTQSERSELYRKYADELLEKGLAYRSFTTAEELERMRQEQEAAGTYNRHDNVDRKLTEEEVQKKLDEGIPYTVRLKVPLSGEVRFKDLVRGEVTMGYDVIDDQVLLKSDGFPTYHLANVVDDHLMGITHVIRGEEWLPSTPKHILLYQALGWDLPEFAHLPLLLNPDKSKLSKRQGDVAVEDYRAKGYLPEAMVNFVSLLGWSPADDREQLSLSELVEQFDLDRVGKSGAVLDVQKLQWFNGQYLRNLDLEKRTALCLPYLKEAGFPVHLDSSTLTVVDTLSKYLTFPGDIVEHASIFYEQEVSMEDREAEEVAASDNSKTVYNALAEKTDALTEWNRDMFKAAVKEVQKDTGIKGKDLFMPIRIALTGKKHGPDIPVIAEVFGKTKTLSRLNDMLKRG